MTSLRHFALLWFVALLPSIAARSVPATKEDVRYFLDGKVVPGHYDIFLMTHVEDCHKKCGYEGRAIVDVTVNKDVVGKDEKVTAIELHSDASLTIKSCQLLDKSGKSVPVTHAFNNKTEFLVVTLNGPNGELDHDSRYQLVFEFEGVNDESMFGFYKSSYLTQSGERRYLLTTQFQPTDARKAFPCFDEPKYKATFQMSIGISKKVAAQKYAVLFNTDVMSIETDTNNVIYKFKKTPMRMSSYLVAFIVSDFLSTNPVPFASIPQKGTRREFRTWGARSHIDGGDADLAQIVGVSAIKLFAEYLGVPFSFPKLDQVGVPDFAAGAMENWGLITYRERMLYYNKKTTSEAVKKSIINVIYHELTHQWFGDLVTLESWDYIWLNEAFATYMSYFISSLSSTPPVDFSKWNFVGQMIVDEKQGRALEMDAMEHTRPMSTKVTNPDVINSYFDTISYAKGGSVVLMWHNALGDGVFRKALNYYLNARKEDVSVPMHLLKSFEKACNETKCIDPEKFGIASDLFENWHTKAGYPVITVERSGKNSFRLSQEQFLWHHSPNGTAPNNKWDVPITFSASSNPQFEDTKPVTWLKRSGEPVTIATAKEENWIVLNNKHTGYYRVNYEPEMWSRLIKQLAEDHGRIHELNRAQLMNDAFSFARSTFKDYKVGYNVPFSLSKYLVREEDYLPWETAFNSFNFLNNKFHSSSKHQTFKDFVVGLLRGRYDALGLTVKNEDSHLENLLRMQVGSWACSFGYRNCVDDALRIYKKGNPHPDVKQIVYCTAIREGGDQIWDEVWKMFTETKDNTEQTLLISALACTNSPKKLSEYLNKTVTPDSGIRPQDYSFTFASVAKAGNVDFALDFLVNRFEDIANSFAGFDPFSNLFAALSSKLNTKKDLSIMKDLKVKFENSDNASVRGSVGSIERAIETIESNMSWLEKKMAAIEGWLEENQKS